jgi:hypothetical protein
MAARLPLPSRLTTLFDPGDLHREKEANMSTEDAAPRKNAEFTRGRPFAKGNPGRPSGSKNRTTAIAQALLADEETELVRKGIELAKAGDVQMLKFLLDRLLPKDRLIKIEIPQLEFADEAVDAMATINLAIAQGRITPNEGATLSGVVTAYSRAIEVWDLSRRIEAIENSLTPKADK